MRKRSEHEIIMDILLVVQKPKTKYEAVQEARSNSRQIYNYLKLVERSGLIQITSDKMLVITAKRRQLVQLYQAAENA
jgi:predicted transcriptional regulator